MDRITSIKSFARAVETGSFSAAARDQKTTQPAISKRIAALEAYLGVKLLQRSPRQLVLTEEGARFYEKCQLLLDQFEQAEASVGRRTQPSGTLRINCPTVLGQEFIMPAIKRFLDQYPDLSLDIRMTDHFVDIIGEGIDLAIRVGELTDSNLIARRIGIARRVAVASPGYLEQAGMPERPTDLLHHECVVFSRLKSVNEWSFQRAKATIKVKVNGRVRTDSAASVRQAVLAGIGIAVSPIWLFGKDLQQGKVTAILTDFEPTPLPINALYPTRQYLPPKVRAFVEFCAEEFRNNPWLSDGTDRDPGGSFFLG